jgi:hypothetical protein
MQGEGATTGVTNGRSWRDASGWFGYELHVPASTAGVSGPSLALLLTYSDGQRDRRFDIVVNDRAIATVALDGQHADRFTDVAYLIPPDVVLAANGVFTVKFVAKSGSRAGAVYDIRLLDER